MNTQVIITKEPNQVIPRGYLQTALKQFPSCIGITIQDLVDNEPVLDISVENRTMSVDDLMKIVESCKDVRMVIVLGNMSQDFDPETDIQPYIFQQKVEGEDEPQNILAFHCEGDFPNYSKPGKGHTDEYNYWEDFIYPTILEKFEASGDLNEFFSRISSSSMKQAVENPISHRGVVVFVPLEGEIIAYGRNDIGGKFEWGTTSQTLGWGNTSKIEAAAETAIAAVKKTGGRLSRLMGTTAPASTAPATSVPQTEKPTIKTDDKGIHHTSGTDPFAAWPGTSAKTHTMMRPPTGLQGNAKNRWIRLFLNLSPQAELPKNKDYSNFMIPVANKLIGFAQEEVTTNDAVKQLADKVKQFHGPAGDPVSQQMAQAHEEKNPKKPAAQPEGDQRPTADFLPECPAEEAKTSAELVAEWATNPKQPTSLEVQKIESKWPLFTVSRGIKLENVARWSIAEKKLFTKRCPNDAARLISELVLKLHEYGAFEPQVEVQPGNKSDGGSPPQPGSPPTEKTPAPAGKKTSRLARLTGSAA